eukprot:COSAG01_NODE_18018_length_1105_cov_1.360835_1_plen_115_part_00
MLYTRVRAANNHDICIPDLTSAEVIVRAILQRPRNVILVEAGEVRELFVKLCAQEIVILTPQFRFLFLESRMQNSFDIHPTEEPLFLRVLELAISRPTTRPVHHACRLIVVIVA